MLEIKNLKVKLNTGKIILEDANLFFCAGELIRLQGENGSGKSSLLLSIFKHPDYIIESGDVFLNGENIKDKKTYEIVKLGIYLGLQSIPEIPGVNTVKFLYKAYKNIYGESKKNILDFKKELEDKCDKFDLSKDFLNRDLNVGYSGGEKKQASLIYLLALMPKYVFLDEPDSGVDTASVKKVHKVINYLKENGSGILITSHNPNIDTDLVFDKSYVIENKKITT